MVKEIAIGAAGFEFDFWAGTGVSSVVKRTRYRCGRSGVPEWERGPNLPRRDIIASRRDIIASRPRRDFKVTRLETRLHEPKIRKYKNDSNTLEYGLY